jgi:hypothetical protein
MAQGPQHNVVSVDRVINAPAASLFAVVSDATRHPEIDGSGALVGAKTGAPHQLAMGSTFGMSMKLGVPYSMSNTVIEFDQDRRIAWQRVLAGPLGRFIGGRIWRYQIRADGRRHQGDRVVGHQPGQAGTVLETRQGRPAHGDIHVQDARPAGRDHRGVTRP